MMDLTTIASTVSIAMDDFPAVTFPMMSSTPGDSDDDDDDDRPKGTTNNTEMDSFDSCSAMMNTERSIFIFFLIFSVIITIGLAFTVRRKNYRLSCCWGRPGFLQPVNFIDEVYRRWAYAACFVILTNDVLGHFVGQSYLNLLPVDDENWMSKIGWVKVFVKLLEALAVCLVYYPLLACINHRRSIAANVLGVIYLIPWITIYSSILYFCPISGDGGFLRAVNYMARLPICLAFCIVGISYVLDFEINLGRRRKQNSGVAVKRTTHSAISDRKLSKAVGAFLGYSILFHLKYVATLLRRKNPEKPIKKASVIRVKSKELIKRVKYDNIMGFRYSTRLVCCTTTAATLVIWIVLINVAWTVDDFERYSKLCEEVANVSLLSFLDPICEYISVAQILFHIANVVAGLIVLMIMINTLVIYRRRWHQLLRGDHSWHMYGTTIDSPSGTLLSGLKYAGYQVAYAAWGWLVLSIALQILLLFLVFAFIVPLITGENYWLINWLKTVWPTVPLGIVIALILKLICRVFFLQDQGSVMALDNRRLYNATSYYFLVLNVIVGIFSCLKRILIPLALGILFLSRLDQPFIIKGFETKDPAYVSFVSMLLVDLYHNHPVVKVFVELMLQVRKREKLLTGVNGKTVIQSEEKLRRSKLIRNRWWKTVTLANNPSLVLEVHKQRLKNERDKAEQTNQSPTNVRNESSSSIEIQLLPEAVASGLPLSKSSSEEVTQVAEK